jgi:hypothetical protein
MLDRCLLVECNNCSKLICPFSEEEVIGMTWPTTKRPGTKAVCFDIWLGGREGQLIGCARGFGEISWWVNTQQQRNPRLRLDSIAGLRHPLLFLWFAQQLWSAKKERDMGKVGKENTRQSMMINDWLPPLAGTPVEGLNEGTYLGQQLI